MLHRASPAPQEETRDLPHPRNPVNTLTCYSAPAPGSRPEGCCPSRYGRSPGSPRVGQPGISRAPRFGPGAAPGGHVPLQGHDFASHAGHRAASRPPLLSSPLASPRPQRRQRLAAGKRAARPGPGRGEGAASPGLAADLARPPPRALARPLSLSPGSEGHPPRPIPQAWADTG